MPFQLLPAIDTMIDLYEKPRSLERFQAYIKTLQGNTKGELTMPVSGFNPMAKEHLLVKLNQLKDLGAENIIEELLVDLNKTALVKNISRDFKVAINLSDDLKGGWTNRFTSDYDSKFKFNGLFSRNFCIPIFWSAETFSKEMVKQRTLAYIFRTIYWLTSPKPITLKEHLEQEIYVSRNTLAKNGSKQTDFSALAEFYKDYENTANYHIIFNFFYGDEASASLSFPTYGRVKDITGFDYARK